MSPNPLSDPVDALLADVIRRIQLNRAQYNAARSGFQAIADWLARRDGPLAGFVSQFYLQGSMSVGATISSLSGNRIFATQAIGDLIRAGPMQSDPECFDIGIVAELKLSPHTPPREILDRLYDAIAGDSGSPYHLTTERRMQSVTVRYSDEICLNVMPAVRVPGRTPRTSWFFQHRPESLIQTTGRKLANPFGFTRWYLRNASVRGSAANYKATAKAALQLMVRWRDVRYLDRTGQRPSWPLLARLNADAASRTSSLAEELERQARHILKRFEQADSRGELIVVTNPLCPEDVFTASWPDCYDAQQRFIHDLRDLVHKTHRLRQSTCTAAELQAIIAGLFGEYPDMRSSESMMTE